MLVRSKVTGPAAPAAEAVTVYWPASTLALAVTLASLPVMPAVAAESVAEAPVFGAAKLTTPPATGSTGSLAVTVTASGLPNVEPAAVDCGVLSATEARVKPALWKAPMSTWPIRRLIALVGGRDALSGGSSANGGAAREQGHGGRRTPVIAQSRQHRIDTDDVVGAAGVVAVASDVAIDVAGDDRVDQLHRQRRPAIVVHASAGMGGVARDGTVRQRDHRGPGELEAAAVYWGVVAADRAVGQRQQSV